jgi:predicted esterase YcpF (UPF0227 family)|tara:strand:- start:907 stop:1275 length:369 start_codon:yes stop_codon:yes gene_type:complete
MEYEELARLAKQNKKNKEQRYKDSSKDRLQKIASKKIQTTMIGALSSIEKHLGFLWSHDQDGELTSEQEEMRELYEEIRSEILDKGNHQIRNLETELSQYDITWLRYQISLPVARMTTKEEN